MNVSVHNKTTNVTDLFTANLVLKHAADVYFFVDTELTIQYANEAAAKVVLELYGKKVYKGAMILSFLSGREKLELEKIFLSVLFGQAAVKEMACTGADKSVLYFETNFTPAYDELNCIRGVVVCARDITEKKRKQQLLQDAEERWRLVLEAANQAAWDWNMQTNEVIYSSAYAAFYGLDTDEQISSFSDWQSRIHPEDKIRMDEAIKDHLQSDITYYETTYRIRTKNNEYKWIMARGRLVSKDADGKPLRMIGTHTDLTETLRTQNELNAMAERFAYAAKASGQALWDWDAITGKAFVSQSFTDLFGWEADANQKFERWHTYIHPNDKEKTRKSYFDSLADPEVSIWKAEYRFLKSDGSYAWVHDKAYILRDKEGKATKVIGASQDITLQKNTKEKLHLTNQRFHNMMMATHDLLWDWDIQANEIYRSKKGLKKVYGLSRNEDIRKMEQWMERVHPEDRTMLLEIFGRLKDFPHKQTFEVAYRFKRDDGRYAHIYDRGILLKNAKGEPVRMIGAAQDVSERKRLEEEILNNELAHKKLINQATVDSQEQERGEIGKELHDNINQVLTTAKLHLELALSNDELLKEMVKKTSKTIADVITEIRELSRSLMNPSLHDLGIVDSITDLIQNINLTQQIKVILHINQDIERALDKKQHLTVYRIIQEALNNVLKHAKATKVEVSITLFETSASLIIADDGKGFKKQLIKKGAGLKNITNRVYLINGSLKIDSHEGEGCRIYIEFPLKTPTYKTEDYGKANNPNSG